MDNINYKTLLDFSKGKYSYNDYLNVKHWFTNVRDDVKVEELLFDQFKEFADSANTKSLHPIFEKIQYHILLEGKRNEIKRNIWYYYRQVAAVIILVLAIPATLYFISPPTQNNTAQSWYEISVPEGGRIEFLLPDSTSGWLNSGARLKYPAEFSPHRRVELIGEAFFNVKHKDHSDFTVGVTDMDIKVLGTKFNVSAYANDPATEVVLKEGKVEIKGKKATFNKVLHPGEKISFNHEKKSFITQTVDPNVYTAWKDGYLVIDNEPLVRAAQKLERWYNVEISIPDEALKNYRFRATFQEEPLEEVLRFIAMTTPITYSIEKRDQSSTGILKKKHVIIKLKR